MNDFLYEFSCLQRFLEQKFDSPATIFDDISAKDSIITRAKNRKRR